MLPPSQCSLLYLPTALQQRRRSCHGWTQGQAGTLPYCNNLQSSLYYQNNLFFFFLRRGSFNWKVLMKCGFGKSEGKMAEYTHTPTSTHPMHTPTCTRENYEIRGAGGKGVEASCTPSSRSSSSSSSSSSLCYCWRPC